jgi:glycosyltransferase involved in cell wall biosynthesis
VRRWQRDPSAAPQLWFTYHVYHKAPDWIGPAASAALGIPYVIAEGSVAQKQRDGCWREGHAAAEAALRFADAVISINPADRAGVAAVRSRDTAPTPLPPFIDAERFVESGREASARLASFHLPDDSPRLIAAAMMRTGDKLASYRLLAAALARIERQPWHLAIIGDGAARTDVEAAFARFDRRRVCFLGLQSAEIVSAAMQSAALFTWPAVTEPIGMVLLEAQACGAPIVAGRRPGVQSIVVDGCSALLVPPGDERAFAEAVATLLEQPERRARMSASARDYVRARHDLPAAACALDRIIAEVIRARTMRHAR